MEWDSTLEPTDDVDSAAGAVPGLIRRVRRLLKVSQRGLAIRLQVSQSVVARWETGRTSPAADVLIRLLEMAGLKLQVMARNSANDAVGDVESGGSCVVQPMRPDAARDLGGRRFPAHADVYAIDWWTPKVGSSHADYLGIWRRSQQRGDPDIGYRLGWRRDVIRVVTGVPPDHPSYDELVTDMRRRDTARLLAQGRAA